jgi:hypothetical protein
MGPDHSGNAFATTAPSEANWQDRKAQGTTCPWVAHKP